jgi:hypothetical protein
VHTHIANVAAGAERGTDEIRVSHSTRPLCTELSDVLLYFHSKIRTDAEGWITHIVAMPSQVQSGANGVMEGEWVFVTMASPKP